MNTATLTRTPLATTALATGPTLMQRLWRSIERHGLRRAAAELRRSAAIRAGGDPALSRQLLAAAAHAEAEAERGSTGI